MASAVTEILLPFREANWVRLDAWIYAGGEGFIALDGVEQHAGIGVGGVEAGEDIAAVGFASAFVCSLREAALAHARENGKRLGRPATAAAHSAEIRKLHRAGVSKSEIARQIQAGRTSARRNLSGASSRK